MTSTLWRLIPCRLLRCRHTRPQHHRRPPRTVARPPPPPPRPAPPGPPPPARATAPPAAPATVPSVLSMLCQVEHPASATRMINGVPLFKMLLDFITPPSLGAASGGMP